MKIRTQLTAAFFLLAVLPLAGIVLYTYLSSRAAVRRTVEAEADAMTREMSTRMASVNEDLARRVERLGELPLGSRLERASTPAEVAALEVEMARVMGDSAGLVRSFEFVPVPPEPPQPPVPPVPPVSSGELQVDVGAAVGAGLGIAGEVLGKLGEEMAALGELESAGDLDPRAAAARRQEIKARIAEKVGEIASERRQIEQRLGRIATWKFQPSREERERLREERERSAKVLGRRFELEVWREGRVVGEVKAEVSAEEVVRRVLEKSRRAEGEIPFALDAAGELYVAEEADRARLAGLPLTAQDKRGGLGNWVVVTEKDPGSGLTFGIARPIRRDLTELGRTAAVNLAWGLGLIAVALLGILPLSRHMTRDLERLTHGVERLAAGDLETRVEVGSGAEIGHLAATFNRMAEDLAEQQQRLLEQERRRQHQELEQRLLQAEYERKSRELEDARLFQLSMLPQTLPTDPAFELAVAMRTAAEVGGDYYDFRLLAGGELVAAVGDATGHGARAGTMVTVIKSLFSAWRPEMGLAPFLAEAAETIRRMELGRMAMALTLVRLAGSRLTLAAAGMPPVLLHRAATGSVEEVAVEGMPLGSFPGFAYRERTIEVAAGDTLLLMSDGLPELPDTAGEPLGYNGARALFERSLEAGAPAAIVERLMAAVAERTGGEAPNDDVTFVVLRVGG